MVMLLSFAGARSLTQDLFLDEGFCKCNRTRKTVSAVSANCFFFLALLFDSSLRTFI